MKRFMLFAVIVITALVLGSSFASMQQQDGRVQPIDMEEVSSEFRSVLQEGIQSNRIDTLDGDYYFLDRFSAEYGKDDKQFKLFRLFDEEVPDLVLLADVTWEASGTYPSLIDTGCGFVFRNNDDAREDEPDSFMHAQLVMEGKDFFWGLNKGKFVSYGRKYYKDPSFGRQTNKVVIFANGSDTSVFINGKEVRRNLDVAVTTPGLIHYTVQSGTDKDYGTRCTFENINLFIPYEKLTSLAIPAEDDTPFDIPPEDKPGDDDKLIPPPEDKPGDDEKLIPPPEDEPGDDGSKLIPPPEDKPEDKPPQIPPVPPLPPIPPASPTPTAPQPFPGPDEGGIPSATPTALPPFPGPDNGGMPSATPTIPQIKQIPHQMTPTPKSPYDSDWIKYPTYDTNPWRNENFKRQPNNCSLLMTLATIRYFESPPLNGFPSCYFTVPGVDFDMKGSYEFCDEIDKIRKSCVNSKKLPSDFHDFCINMELQLQERGILYAYELNDREAYETCKEQTGPHVYYRAIMCELYQKTYKLCLMEKSYQESPCRKYLIDPPQSPNAFQKRIMEVCQSCAELPGYAEKKGLAVGTGLASDGCARNTNYLLCNNREKLYFIKGFNQDEIDQINEYCKKYGIGPEEPIGQIQQAMKLPGGAPPEDGTKQRPETSPVKPDEEEDDPIVIPTVCPWGATGGC